MILETLIGKRKGNPSENDISKITDYLHSQKATADTNKEALKNNEIYIIASNLTDPQSFYQYLSQNGYTLIIAKMIEDPAKLNDSDKD